MNTFKWTVPEPGESRADRMDEREFGYWQRVRRRGAEWYVVSKGLFFMVGYPVLGHFVIGWEANAELLGEGWLLGLVAGAVMWMRNEIRFQRTSDELPGRQHELDD